MQNLNDEKFYSTPNMKKQWDTTKMHSYYSTNQTINKIARQWCWNENNDNNKTTLWQSNNNNTSDNNYDWIRRESVWRNGYNVDALMLEHATENLQKVKKHIHSKLE